MALAEIGGLAGLAMAYGGARPLLDAVAGKSYLPIQATPSLQVLAFAPRRSLPEVGFCLPMDKL